MNTSRFSSKIFSILSSNLPTGVFAFCSCTFLYRSAPTYWSMHTYFSSSQSLPHWSNWVHSFLRSTIHLISVFPLVIRVLSHIFVVILSVCILITRSANLHLFDSVLFRDCSFVPVKLVIISSKSSPPLFNLIIFQRKFVFSFSCFSTSHLPSVIVSAPSVAVALCDLRTRW